MEGIMSNPDPSKVEEFKKFIVKPMQPQEQFDHVYHDDKYLRDRLITVVDIPPTQVEL